MEIEDQKTKIPSRKRFPFSTMAIGDSMFFSELSEVESAQNASYAYAKRRNNGFKMTRRKVDEAEGGGYRLWRIA